MKILSVEQRESTKTGNSYYLAILDNGHSCLLPDWFADDVDLPFDVKLCIKDFGKWTIRPIFKKG
jgi:hypothetical protein